LLQTLRQLSRTQGLTVGLILHDLNQVLQFADRTYCVQAGRIVAGGKTVTVLTPALIRDVFQVEAKLISGTLALH
jgi:iron complex transport system ATP-binding protein